MNFLVHTFYVLVYERNGIKRERERERERVMGEGVRETPVIKDCNIMRYNIFSDGERERERERWLKNKPV